MNPPQKNACILVVDDDEGLRLLMAEVLRGGGYEIAAAGSGSEALAWLEGNRPDLMLLDLKMKDVGGQALVKRLKQHDTPVPFLVVTGQGDEKVAVDVMKEGALDYVMKDTGMLDLLPGVVERALDAIERERRLSETRASLLESEARFAAAVRATNDGVWEWRIPDGGAYYSARWKAILGYQPNEIADTRDEWRERVHPQDIARVDRAFGDFLGNAVPALSIEYRMQHRDGTCRWIHSRAVLIRDSEGRPLRMVGANADVTERKELEQELLSVTDREQRRIGQDLHDGLGQQLTAIELMCHTLRVDLKKSSPEVREQISAMSGFLRQAIMQTRALAHGLTAFMVDAAGLQGAIAELVGSTTQIGRGTARFVCPATVRVKDGATAMHLYRIAQEAITNAVKHASATMIEVSLLESGGTVTLRIADNGVGLPESNPGPDRGVGMQVMRYRAAAIGADLSIDSKAGKGVTVTCAIRQNGSR